MMSRIMPWIAMLFIAAAFGGGCEETIHPAGAPVREPMETTIGEVHNAFLRNVHAQQDVAESYLEAAVAAANELSSVYGTTPLSREEVEYWIHWGRERATMDPDDVVAECLDEEELEWWEAFSSTATVENLREQFTAFSRRKPFPHCGVAGPGRAQGRAPERDRNESGGATRLSTMMEVVVASAEYWSEFHEHDEPVLKNTHILDDPLYPEEPTGWKRRLARFACNVVVDGVAGGLAGMGGGPVAGGIVGGLASYGADQILFDEEG